jgi:hypothetical protein
MALGIMKTFLVERGMKDRPGGRDSTRKTISRALTATGRCQGIREEKEEGYGLPEWLRR